VHGNFLIFFKNKQILRSNVGWVSFVFIKQKSKTNVFILLIRMLSSQRNPTQSQAMLRVGLRWEERSFYHQNKIANIYCFIL
jgi:hypothetical protein